ncbi:hypothetical protein LAV79_22800 [Peribacillus butanolivorans]|uniref:hypothetical protein n=1 Tax=Peribacillus butanolivorans TaxID=421767 RepID=UPI0030C9EDB6
MKIKWGAYLWKLRLLLFIPILLYGILVFSSLKNIEDFPSYYFLILAVYTLISSTILHKMEKKAKKEKE